jgi:predicted NBD/HSP70 family sugar kinase
MLGEHRYGVAKGASNAVYLFSGVGGIGGGFIVDGRILTGANSLAGEIGKMRLLGLEPESRQTLGDALQRSPLAVALTGGKSGSQITDAQLDEALSGTLSSEVNRTLDSQIGALVSAIATLRDLFDPEKIILGGYLGSVLRVRRNEIEFLLDRESFGRKSRDFLVARPLEVKEMVLLGGAAEAWQSVLSNPQSIRKGATDA